MIFFTCDEVSGIWIEFSTACCFILVAVKDSRIQWFPSLEWHLPNPMSCTMPWGWSDVRRREQERKMSKTCCFHHPLGRMMKGELIRLKKKKTLSAFRRMITLNSLLILIKYAMEFRLPTGPVVCLFTFARRTWYMAKGIRIAIVGVEEREQISHLRVFSTWINQSRGRIEWKRVSPN